MAEIAELASYLKYASYKGLECTKFTSYNNTSVDPTSNMTKDKCCSYFYNEILIK